jgi:hypothetical protein
MLALVGDQPMPNIIAALQHPPQCLELLVTGEEYEQIALNIERVLRDKLGKVHCHQIEVKPYEINDVRARCEELVRKYGQDIIFNITGGTKTMSNAAYEVALRHDIPTLYVETGNDQIIHLIPSARPSERFRIKVLKVDDYLRAHNVEIKREGGKLADRTAEAERLPQNLREAAEYLAHEAGSNYIAMDMLRYGLKKAREEHKGSDPMKIRWPRSKLLEVMKHKNWPPEVEGQFHRLLGDLSHSQYGVINAFTRHPNGDMELEVTLAQHDFIKGDWLEYFVFGEAKKRGTFDDCRMDLRISWRDRWRVIEAEEGQLAHERLADRELPHNELDVVVMKGTRLTICSCKSARLDEGQAAGKEAIYELETIARSVGLYCGKVLAMSRDAEIDGGDLSVNFVKRALILGIAPVTARYLPLIGEIMENPGAQIEEWKKRLV